jgi:hypothetical protein
VVVPGLYCGRNLERDTLSSLGRREDGSVAGPHDAQKTSVFLTITEGRAGSTPHSRTLRSTLHDTAPTAITASPHTMADAPPPTELSAAPEAADAGDATQKPVKRSWRYDAPGAHLQ